MPIRELNTSTKIETAPAPAKPGHRIYLAPRVSADVGIALRVARGKNGGVKRTIQVITRDPDRKEHRVFVTNWPPADGQSLNEVMARAREIRDRIRKGLSPYPPLPQEETDEPPLSEIWKRYAKATSSMKRPSTVSYYESLWRLHIGPHIGQKRPSDLTYDVIRHWYDKLAKKSTVNANRGYKLLKAVLNFARQKWKEPWARDNPLDVLGSEDRHRERRRTIILTKTQRETLLQCIREHPIPTESSRRRNNEPDIQFAAKRQSADCLLLIALTGCRKSEALDARWNEFDFENGYWSIPATRTKQKKLNRFPLMPDALAHIRALHEKRVSDTLVFPQCRDATKTQDTLKRSWRTIITRAGLTKITNHDDGTIGELRIHDLRHVFGTTAVEAGLGLEVVAGLLGHSQISTTQRYAHVHDKVLKAGIDKLAAHLGSVDTKAAAE